MYHACKDEAHWPYVNAIVVVGVIEVQLRGFVVHGAHLAVVLPLRKVILRKPKVNQFQLLTLGVDQHVEGLDIAMHHPLRVHIVQSLPGTGITSSSCLM